MTALPPLMTIPQLAEHLGVDYQVAHAEVCERETFGPKDQLPKIGRQYRIPGPRVEAFCRGDLEQAKGVPA